MDRLKSLLFGSIQSIEIHSATSQTGDRVRDGVLASMKALGKAVPVSIKPACLDIEFVMVHYGRGLFRPAHADVVVLN